MIKLDRRFLQTFLHLDILAGQYITPLFIEQVEGFFKILLGVVCIHRSVQSKKFMLEITMQGGKIRDSQWFVMVMLWALGVQ